MTAERRLLLIGAVLIGVCTVQMKNDQHAGGSSTKVVAVKPQKQLHSVLLNYKQQNNQHALVVIVWW